MPVDVSAGTLLGYLGSNRMAHYKSLLPSIISVIRLLLALALPFCSEWIWIWFVLAAGGSDVLDGWLARRWKVESWQGGLIDAIADKVFVLTVLIVFAFVGKFAPFWIPVIIARDLMVLLTALYAVVCRDWGAFKIMNVRVSGKLTTGGQFAFFVIVLLLPEHTGYGLFVVVFCSITAAADYGRLFIQALLARQSAGSNRS